MPKIKAIKAVWLAIALTITPLFPSNALAFRSSDACISVCIGTQSQFGEAMGLAAQLPAQFRLAVWNVYKGGYSHSNQGLELAALLQEAHIALIQEAIGDPSFIRPLMAANAGFRWTLAHAFYRISGDPTGVATGSNTFPLWSEVQLSPVTEPIVKTPKSILITKYFLESSSEPLLVINVHGINFVSISSYRKHVDQMVEAAGNHQGPVILAGDFNTWSSARMEYLLERTAQLGLSRIPIEVSSSRQLDHVFTRGLQPLAAQEISWFTSSDHWPLVVDLKVEQ